MRYKPLNICLDCRYFEFYPFYPGYSEYTPGSDMSIGCGKDYWCANECSSQEQFKEKMCSATTCKDYEPNVN